MSFEDLPEDYVLFENPSFIVSKRTRMEAIHGLPINILFGNEYRADFDDLVELFEFLLGSKIIRVEDGDE